jgi:hypothetical protein
VKPHPGLLCFCLYACLQFCGANVLAADAAEAATQPAVTAGISASDQALRQVTEELTDLDRRWYGLMRFRWSYPQKLSAGLGVMVVQQPRDADCATGCMVHGWHFEVEPGLYGLQGSAGWGKLVGETGRTEHLMTVAYYGWAVRAVVLRTWGDSPLTPTSQTLAGIEGGFSIIRLNFSLGLMRSLASHPDEDWLISVGMGWGF